MNNRPSHLAPAVPREWLPFLTGRCFDFALALHERMPQFEFVALGDPKFPDHIALRLADRFFDVRGELAFSELVRGLRDGDRLTLADVHVVERDDVTFHCGLSGVEVPYPRLHVGRHARKRSIGTASSGNPTWDSALAFKAAAACDSWARREPSMCRCRSNAVGWNAHGSRPSPKWTV